MTSTDAPAVTVSISLPLSCQFILPRPGSAGVTVQLPLSSPLEDLRTHSWRCRAVIGTMQLGTTPVGVATKLSDAQLAAILKEIKTLIDLSKFKLRDVVEVRWPRQR